jgi:outer membrane protein assembly factor BamA
MIQPAVYLVYYLLLVFWDVGFAGEDLFEATRLIVEIEWRGQANMGQDEFLDLIGVQIGDTLQRDAIRRSIERLYFRVLLADPRRDCCHP